MNHKTIIYRNVYIENMNLFLNFVFGHVIITPDPWQKTTTRDRVSGKIPAHK